MCGRYVSKIEAAMERAWEIKGGLPDFESYNVAPSTQVPVVRLGERGRVCRLVRWGLVPFWAKGEPPKYATINATCERMQTAASYRGPWKRGQRCLFPATHFYEWQVIEGSKRKQPWCVRVADAEVFAMAGIWERSTRADGEVVESATIVTMPANELMAEIHNDKKRMPLILPEQAFNAWLGGDAQAASAAVLPFPASRMAAWPVSTRVNSPRNNDASCLEASEETRNA